MKKILIIAFAILSYNCYSQIKFEKGYFIKQNNEKIECFIKNLDWKNNPTEFKYKTSENGKILTATFKDFNEFSIYEYSKYIKATVNIDRSSSNIDDLTSNKNPVYTKETLILKLLIEGEANLYYYEDSNLRKFFFKNKDSKIEPLVHKEYKTIDNTIGTNDHYKQQLWMNLKCDLVSKNSIKTVKYNKTDLVKIFNRCSNSNFTNFDKKQKKELIHLTVKAGLNNASFELQDRRYNITNFGTITGVKFGVEVEALMPFHKNKWGLIFAPLYNSNNQDGVEENNGSDYNKDIFNIEYKSIELNLGLRHYFFINDNSKIFITFSYVIDIPMDSKIERDRQISDIPIDRSTSTAFGLGFKYKKNYSIELQKGSSRLITDSSSWNSDYSYFSILFGYTLF